MPGVPTTRNAASSSTLSEDSPLPASLRLRPREALPVAAPLSVSPFLRQKRYNATMKLFLVTFNLLDSGDYASLVTRLASMHAVRILENQWAVLSQESARTLKDTLRGLIGEQDRIVVTQVGPEWASRRALANLGDLIEPAGGPARMLWRRKRGLPG